MTEWKRVQTKSTAPAAADADFHVVDMIVRLVHNREPRNGFLVASTMFRSDLLQDKRVLVTGGGTGLGKAMGRRFVELGARLVICGRREQVLRDTQSEFDRQFPGRTECMACDLRDPAQVDALIDGIWTGHGGLDVLVNNAAGNIAARTETLSHRALDAVLATVLHGTAYATLACGKKWLAQARKGSVLSIVANYAWSGSAYVVPSAMGKAGVLAMTRSLAVEWGPRGIRLNAIAPGPFPTEGAWSRLVPRQDLAGTLESDLPLGRPGRPEELANLAAYLIADESEYITGEVVAMDGGQWLLHTGQFNFLRGLADADWDMMRPKRG
jgi:NAD(P)-dependent dehydrogenase (short-subunit alcohol dehydrogenase family)